MTASSAMTPEVRAAVTSAVEALPADATAEAALAAVPQIAILAAHPEAAAAYPNVRRGLEMAEFGRLHPTTPDERPRTVSRGYLWLSVTALVLALVAPALIMTGRNGRAFEPEVGALPSGILMALSLVLFIWLEPRRTSSPLYRGGDFGAPLFVVTAVLWAIGAFIVLGSAPRYDVSPEAAVGLVLQILSALGSVVLAVFAFRHDRERPTWAGGRKPRLGVPPEIAGLPEFRAAVEDGVVTWRRHVFSVSTQSERAALVAAEEAAVAVLRDRGTLTASQFDQALQRVRSRADWT
ncbi:hypothetical protein [Agromyces allii]|uniref:Uncharacterized protein n=1 Tax=Agromyces allii TaxID=393607 RepID=A0ABP5BEF8_9MICO|nr:hypothetical protein [Agromyces allii]